MNKQFNGPLGGHIAKHLKLRRSLGFLLHRDEIALREFERYLDKHFPDAKTVTRTMVMGHLQSLRNLHAVTLHRHLTSLRQFCRFLFQLNPDTYIPERGLLPPATPNRTAHIYSLQEAKDLIKAARQLTPQESLRPHTYTTLISLLWATGLRIGEALRLNLEDVDITNAVLYIRQSKFFKSRIVPLTASSASALQKYEQLRMQHGHDQRLTAPFFVSERAKRFAYVTVNHTFLAIVRQLGMKNAQAGSPRLHDFRHTFATRCLSNAYKSGKDPGAILPLLATYLGHVHIAYTQLYLHPPTETLQNASHLFHQHIADTEKGGNSEGN